MLFSSRVQDEDFSADVLVWAVVEECFAGWVIAGFCDFGFAFGFLDFCEWEELSHNEAVFFDFFVDSWDEEIFLDGFVEGECEDDRDAEMEEFFQCVFVERFEFSLCLDGFLFGWFFVEDGAEIGLCDDEIWRLGDIRYFDFCRIFQENFDDLICSAFHIFVRAFDGFVADVGTDDFVAHVDGFGEHSAAAAEWVVDNTCVLVVAFVGAFRRYACEVDHHLCEFWWEHAGSGVSECFAVISFAVGSEILDGSDFC